MANTPKKSPMKATPKKSPKKSPMKSPKSLKKSPAKTPKKTPMKSPKVEKAIKKDGEKKKRTTTKDPNAPKRAMSGYMFFMTKGRDDLIKKYGLDPKSVSEVGKKAGEVWGKMTDAEKKPYLDMAEKDKARAEKEKESYVPDPSQFKTKKGAKPEKDPNAPKRATTGYFFFMNENRAKIIADHKLEASKPALVASKAGELWGQMSDADKKPYLDKAEADKSRYERELAAYKA